MTGVSDEAVEMAEKAWRRAYHAKPFSGTDKSWMRVALEAAAPLMSATPTCTAEHPRGFGRCVFVAGHHEVESWTPHADRFGRTWNDQPVDRDVQPDCACTPAERHVKHNHPGEYVGGTS